MTSALAILAGAALILLFATIMIVVMPSLQTQSRSHAPDGLKPYSEQALRGRKLYVGLGCMYCHSQQPRDPGQAPDGVRGWGRPSIPGDYAYDSPHLLGTMRTGPDLLNIGARQPSTDWHLTHLYNPRAVVPGSTMPAFPFLFEVRPRESPTDVEVRLGEEFSPGGQVFATQAALDIVQYLKELDRTYPVAEIPTIDRTPANKGAAR